MFGLQVPGVQLLKSLHCSLHSYDDDHDGGESDDDDYDDDENFVGGGYDYNDE